MKKGHAVHINLALLKYFKGLIIYFRRSSLIELDTRGLLCPLPVLKLRKLIKNINEKEKIKLITDDPAAIVDVPHFCNEQSYRILESHKENSWDVFIIEL